MAQKYKVYFSNRPVIFTQSEPEASLIFKGAEIIRSCGKMDILLIESAVARGAKAIYVVCTDVEGAWKKFSEQFEFVQAAGGLVLNDEGKLLFIYRHEKWDLPKGKVEDNEQIDAGALREVEEECAIGDLEILYPLQSSWHTYIQKGDPMLKCTAWYVMKYNGTAIPQPQLEEGITETRWLDVTELNIVKANTYPSVLDVIEDFLATK
jgi:ADP-ribose pyrophosphatase YjhB (NUDIX family)